MRLIPSLKMTLFSALLVLSISAIQSTYAQPSTAPTYIEGKHYQLLENPIKTRTQDKIELINVFWYGSGHGYRFHAAFDQWERKQANDVVIDYMPAMWNESMITHARIYYTVKALGLDKSMHAEIYDAMHRDRKKLVGVDQIFPLFEKHGIMRAVFDTTFNSFSVGAMVQMAQRNMREYGISGVPELIVNGKYLISNKTANGSYVEMLQIATFLVEKERSSKKP